MYSLNKFTVAPFAGVWIEIIPKLIIWLPTRVAPFAGVWIEIPINEWILSGLGRTLGGCVGASQTAGYGNKSTR